MANAIICDECGKAEPMAIMGTEPNTVVRAPLKADSLRCYQHRRDLCASCGEKAWKALGHVLPKAFSDFLFPE